MQFSNVCQFLFHFVKLYDRFVDLKKKELAGSVNMAAGKTKEMDMLNGRLAGKLILFSLPLACSSILQQLFNSADVAVVGRFFGDTALAAVLRSFGDTRRPMYYLIVSGTINVILNLILVIVFGLGVAGVQGAIFSVSNVFIQSGINSFGEAAIAGSSLALNFEYFTYDIAAAFAQAAVTFTSQNFGAGNIKRCKKIFWLCMLFGIGFTEILSIIFILWDNFFVGIYTTSASVAAFGIIRMRHVCSLEGLTATYEVESAALRGMEKSLEPSVITILGTVVFRMI